MGLLSSCLGRGSTAEFRLHQGVIASEKVGNHCSSGSSSSLYYLGHVKNRWLIDWWLIDRLLLSMRFDPRCVACVSCVITIRKGLALRALRQIGIKHSVRNKLNRTKMKWELSVRSFCTVRATQPNWTECPMFRSAALHGSVQLSSVHFCRFVHALKLAEFTLASVSVKVSSVRVSTYGISVTRKTVKSFKLRNSAPEHRRNEKALGQ